MARYWAVNGFGYRLSVASAGVMQWRILGYHNNRMGCGQFFCALDIGFLDPLFFTDPELIHVHEKLWVFQLVLMPVPEIGGPRILGESCPVIREQGGHNCLEAQKIQIKGVKYFLNLPQGELMLLGVKIQVAAFRQGEKIFYAAEAVSGCLVCSME